MEENTENGKIESSSSPTGQSTTVFFCFPGKISQNFDLDKLTGTFYCKYTEFFLRGQFVFLEKICGKDLPHLDTV
jgi:hypothetical protein